MLFSFLSALFTGSALISCCYAVAAACAVFRFSRQSRIAAAGTPACTVLKPLCGDEHELLLNLRSFCRQDYPNYQIVFGIQDASDAALPVVRQLMEEFPQRDIALVVDSTRASKNMKVANLQNMLQAAKHDCLVISDSDMRVPPHYLSEVTAALANPSVGAVTCLYRGISQKGFWSDMGCLNINFGFLVQALLGAMLGVGDGCFGATIAINKKILAQLGGFGVLGDVLADDHALGQLIKKAGMRVALSPCLIDHVVDEPDLQSLFRHETRWAITIRMAHQTGYAGSFITHSVALAMLGVVFSVACVFSLWVLALTVALRFCTALLTARVLRLPLRQLWLLPLRDMLSFAVFLNGFFCRTVTWRGRTLRIRPGGRITLDGD